MNVALIKKPSAFLPLLMSLIALALLLGHVAIYGIVHETDEGTPAHIFQLLMTAQVPIIGFFVIKWLPQMPESALPVLAMQAAAAVAAISAVFFLT